MDAFVEAWYAIDTDMGGVISIDELRDYARSNNYDDAFVQVRHIFTCITDHMQESNIFYRNG